MADTSQDTLTQYLRDVHSIEEQALVQLRRAPAIAGDESLGDVFRDHLRETQSQERRVRERLAGRGAEPSRLKDVAGQAGGYGMLLFARSQPDTPGKLTAHAFSYEHLELAAYELLAAAAEREGDEQTVALARAIGEEESAMGARLAENFDRAVDASLRGVSASELPDQLVSYLADAHAIESQALQLLEHPPVDGDSELAAVFRGHLEETRGHEEALRARLEAHDARPSRFKDTLLRIGGLNLGGFFGVQPGTRAKLAGFAFAFEHLEIAAYELLARVASLAGDRETEAVARRIAGEERAAAAAIRECFEPSIEKVLSS